MTMTMIRKKQDGDDERRRHSRRLRAASYAAASAAAAATASRLAREAELEDRMLRQQQEALAGDGRGWEPADWRWRPLVTAGGGGGGRGGEGAASAANANTTNAARAAVAAYAHAADDLEAPLRGLRLLMAGPRGGGEAPPLALLAFLRRGLDEACSVVRMAAAAAAAAAADEAAAASAAAPSTTTTPSSSSSFSSPALRILVLGGGVPLALAAAAAARQAGAAAPRVVLVEPSPWGRRAARRLLEAVAIEDGGADAAITVVATPAEAAAAWGGGGGARQQQPAHVLVTDLFASGAVVLPPGPPPEKAAAASSPAAALLVPAGSSSSRGGSPFALGLLPALRAAHACGAAHPSATAFVPSRLRLHAALASAEVPAGDVTCGVDLSPLDPAYRWSPPGSGGFAAAAGGGGGGSGGGSGGKGGAPCAARALSASFPATELDLASVGGDAPAALACCKTTRVEATSAGACNAVLVWAEPVVAVAGASAPSSFSPPSSCCASLWYPPHRPLPLEQGDTILVRASVASGRPAALELEFCDVDDVDDGDEGEDEGAGAISEGGDLSLALARADAATPPAARGSLLDRPLHGAVLPSWHLEMVSDAARNEAYNRAIRRAVKGVAEAAGAATATAGQHAPAVVNVLDIGAGSGLLSVMAAR
jgi:hypothetical protein